MPPRGTKRPAADAVDMHKQLAIVGNTRAGLAATIESLIEGGWLTDEAVAHARVTSTSWQITRAVDMNASKTTPYGKLLQNMRLPSFNWKICHPLALVYYLASVSSFFYNLMKSCIQPGVPLNIIIYIDSNH